MDWEVRRFAEIDSTNRYLLDEARRGAPDGLVAVADHQTAGRGRLGRSWEAPPGSSLLVSVLLRPRLPVERLHLVTAALAVAAAGACGAVHVVLPDEMFTGTAADVDDDGRLLVNVGACIRTVSAGDVIHLRPAD